MAGCEEVFEGERHREPVSELLSFVFPYLELCRPWAPELERLVDFIVCHAYHAHREELSSA